MTQEELDKFERDLKVLATKMEQYFLGVERLAPLKDRERLLFQIRRAPAIQNRNTAFRFRFQALVNKFHVYDRYWQTTIRRIEDGTYQRHVFKANLKQGGRATPSAPAAEPASPSPTASPLPAAPGTPPAGTYPQAVERLYRNYLAARQQCNLPVEGVGIDKINTMVQARLQKLRQEHGERRIVFKVEIKDGKPLIKAVVKEA